MVVSSVVQRISTGMRRPVPQTQGNKRKALLIGINYIHKHDENFVELHGPIDDVTKMQRALIDYHGFKPEDLTIMTDKEKDPKNKKIFPNKKNVIAAIKALVADARPGDVFVFHYAGHTDQDQEPDGKQKTEEDGLDEYIVTADLQRIIDDDLRRWLVDSLPEGSRLTAILDCCHSGTLLDLLHYECNCAKQRRASTTEFNLLPNSMAASYFGRRSVTFEGGYLRRSQKFLKDNGTKLSKRVRNVMGIQKGGSTTEVAAQETTEMPALTNAVLPCGPYCRRESRPGPIVISISSCADSQFSWEADTTEGASTTDEVRGPRVTVSNKSMTSALVRVLQSNPAVTVDNLKKIIDRALFDFACAMHVGLREYKERYGHSLTREEQESLKEQLREFEAQKPQVGSLRHLSGDEVFIQGREGHEYEPQSEVNLLMSIKAR